MIDLVAHGAAQRALPLEHFDAAAPAGAPQPLGHIDHADVAEGPRPANVINATVLTAAQVRAQINARNRIAAGRKTHSGCKQRHRRETHKLG